MGWRSMDPWLLSGRRFLFFIALKTGAPLAAVTDRPKFPGRINACRVQ
jgi:hypothetical protein